MTPSKYIKAQGLPNLAYVADKVGKHPDTINNWYHANFALFEVVVAGVWLAWVEENKEPDPTITEEDKEQMRAFLKRATWNQ